MSDSEAEAADEDPVAGRGEIWIEKYRPERLDDVVGHEDIVDRLQRYVEQDDLPHLLFAGPAGTGKCVVGETPVLTSAGVERIENVVGDVEGFDTPKDDLEVLTFDDGEFRFTRPSHTFSRTSDEVVSVATRDGNDVTVTPEHPLLVLDEEGFGWKEAADLVPGDRVARPLSMPTPDDDPDLDWTSTMDDQRTLVHVSSEFAKTYDIPVEEDHVGTKKAVIERLRRGASEDDIATELDTPRKTVRAYSRQVSETDLDEPSTICSLGYLLDLDVPMSAVVDHVEAIQSVHPSNNVRSQPISPPRELAPKLAEFVGLVVSEARIDGGRIQFYNTDDDLLERFQRTATEVFDVETNRGKNKGVPFVEINSRTLTRYLEACFDVFAGATEGDGIGSTLVRADVSSRTAFLRAVFDSEAYVSDQGTIELTQKNERLITLVSYLLATFGIPSRRTTERKAATNGSGIEREYHTLYVSGATAVERFRDAIGFTLTSKSERLQAAADKKPNPNQDTVPVQSAVDTLCDELHLSKSELLTESLNPNSPGRENYLDDVERVLDASAEKIETAQSVLETVERLQADVDAVAATPTTWLTEREQLQPLAVRKSVSETTGVRTCRLLEYADGRRTPPVGRTTTLLETLETEQASEPSAGGTRTSIQSSLRSAIESLGVPYAHLAEETDYHGTDFINLLENDDHSLASAPRFTTLADAVTEAASRMLSSEVLAALSCLELVANGDLYYDEVEQVEHVDEERRVYDLTVPDSHNYVGGNVPTVMHNTASSVAIAKELYGDDWETNFLELNASDERGIDVVRDRIKDFARSSLGGDHNYRIIFLDEADALTSDAQAALRRTMEQFSHNTRFILSCNYSSQIIDPIQSRCTVFRFSPLGDDAVADRVRHIADAEGLELTEDGVDALVYAADGDMRKAINALQAAATMQGPVDEEAVFTLTATARPEEVEAMVEHAIDGDFPAARARLDELLTEKGLAGGDLIDQLHRSVWEFDLEDDQAVRVLDRVGEADYRITEGANERIQLEALLASLALDD